jgi:endonuclease-3
VQVLCAMKRAQVAEQLLEHGRELHRTRPSPVHFTQLPEANALVNDIARYPHAFVLACIMDRQVKAERAWTIPYEVQERVGGFSFTTLAALTPRQIARHLVKPKPLHRFPARMASYFHSAIRRIEHQYQGDASRIWQCKPSSAEVVRRFLAFDGVGPKIATMAANILARDFKIPMSDYYSIDISVDVHVRRVFARLGLVAKNASAEELIYTARAIEPSFPGLLDLPAWEIGRHWCKPRRPLCSECYMCRTCPTARAERPSGM